MKEGDCRIWMPLYIGDYLSDTIHLKRAEHGSYILCMMAYWRKQGPLTDDEFRRVAGKEIDSVSRFFAFEDGHWFHERTQKEIEKAFDKMRSLRERSMKGVAARGLKAHGISGNGQIANERNG